MISEHEHWSSRIKKATDQSLQLIGEYGPAIGMSGAAIAGAFASAYMFKALGVAGTEDAQLLREAAATAIATGTASAISGALLGKFGRHALGDVEYQRMTYDERWESQVDATINAPKGAVPVIDDPTRGPEFREAMHRAINTIDNDPQTKAEFVKLLSRSPEARQALIDEVFQSIEPDSKQQDVALNLLRASNQSPKAKDEEQASDGPSIR